MGKLSEGPTREWDVNLAENEDLLKEEFLNAVSENQLDRPLFIFGFADEEKIQQVKRKDIPFYRLKDKSDYLSLQ
jgi:hypothetical protein